MTNPLPNGVFKRSTRVINPHIPDDISILSPQEVANKLVKQIHDELEESVLALMAGGLPISNIEIRFDPPLMIENQISGVAQLMLTNLKDRAPENYQPTRPDFRRFLEPK
ncbi:hypothetical protein [Pseudoalteromonas phage KB12-38]|nr:hypothetical protein [Pseudoalteromonas phage KB12-38]